MSEPQLEIEMLDWNIIPQYGIIFQWTISHFVLHMKNTPYAFESATFTTLDIPYVKWFLRLSISRNYRREQILSLSLRRAKDYGPNCVQVNYKLFAVDTGIKRRLKKCESLSRTVYFYHQENQDSQVTTDEKCDLEWVTNDYNPSDQVTVGCYVYPVHEATHSPRKRLSWHKESELKILREEICSLYEDQQLLDIELCVGESKIRAHKSLLCARLPILALELSLEESEKRFVSMVITGIEFEVLNLLVKYIYTGNLNSDINDLPSGLYSAAERYVPNYEGKLLPTLRVRRILTFATMHREVFHWHIRDFQSLKPEVTLFAPVINIDSVEGLEFKLALYMELDEDGDQDVRMILRRISPARGKTATVFFQVSVNDSNGSQKTYFQGYNRYKVFQDWVMPPIVKKSNLLNLKSTYLNCLSLTCEIVVSVDDGGRTVVEETLCTEETAPAQLEEFDDLKDDLENMFRTRKYSDLEIQIGDVCEPAHKAILCARSPVIKRMVLRKWNFSTCSGRNTKIVVENAVADHEDLQNILYYMYTGELKDLTYETAVKLYNLAKHFEVFRLEEKCSAFLKSCMTPENVEELLRLATEHSDVKLKSKAQKYIHLLACELRRTYPFLTGSHAMSEGEMTDSTASRSDSLRSEYLISLEKSKSSEDSVQTEEAANPVAEAASAEASGTQKINPPQTETVPNNPAGTADAELGSRRKHPIRVPRHFPCGML